MKKRFLLFALLLCGCFALTSCEKTPDEPAPTDGIDRSLAGSMQVPWQYITKAEGLYDATSLVDMQVWDSVLGTGKVSDTEQDFECILTWSDAQFYVYLPVVPVTGEPFVEVRFDHICPNATVMHNQVEYTNIPTTIKGWIKDVVDAEEYRGGSPALSCTRMTPAKHLYTCDIELTCTIDGKELWFHITKLRPA